MRASPAFQISLRHFGVWRGAVAGLTLLGVAALATWGLGGESPVGPARLGVTAAAMLATVAFAIPLWRTPVADLRWDGAVWQLDGLPHTNGEAVAGALAVTIDLGAWMMLRFTPADPHARPRRRWIPAQRRGSEAHWHALRCAAYSPHPARAGNASAEV